MSRSPAARSPRALALSVVVCLAVTMLAGCTNPPGSVEDGTPQSRVETAHFDESTGAIEGLVVDDTLRPIDNASITIRPAIESSSDPIRTESAMDGRFVASLLEPGYWVVTASRSGFEDASAFVNVAAANVAHAQIVMTDVPADEPHAVLLIANGFVGCQMAMVVFTNWCVNPNIIELFPEETELHHEVPAGHQLTIAETTWEDTSVSFGVQYNVIQGDDWHALTIVPADTPPLRFEMAPEQGFVYNPYSQTGADREDFVPPENETWTLQTLNGYAGSYRQTFAALDPVCRPVYGFCFGVGVATELRFTQYVTVFVNGVPPDVNVYTAIPDA